MPILNPSFEAAGAAPGLAAHWTLRTFVARERIAGFGPPPHLGREDFERWLVWTDAFDRASAAVAVFEPRRQAFEDYEAGWGNDAFLFELPVGATAVAPFGPDGPEGFETGWAGLFLATWGFVTAERASFGGETAEGFLRGWRAAEAAVWAWAATPSRSVVFAGGEPAESFEGGDWPSLGI